MFNMRKIKGGMTMLGFNKCVYCKKENPYDTATDAYRHDWAKLTLRNDESLHYKFSGLVCPECAMNTFKPLFFNNEEHQDA